MPIPFEAVRYHLRAGSAVDADEDGVFFAAGDVNVGRKDFEHVEFCTRGLRGAGGGLVS